MTPVLFFSVLIEDICIDSGYEELDVNKYTIYISIIC